MYSPQTWYIEQQGLLLMYSPQRRKINHILKWDPSHPPLHKMYNNRLYKYRRLWSITDVGQHMISYQMNNLTNSTQDEFYIIFLYYFEKKFQFLNSTMKYPCLVYIFIVWFESDEKLFGDYKNNIFKPHNFEKILFSKLTAILPTFSLCGFNILRNKWCRAQTRFQGICRPHARKTLK